MKLSKRGGVALIIAIIILSYMMMVSTSQFQLLQLENTGHISKNMSKKAYFCAFSGIQFALERVREDVTKITWDKRPYFTNTTSDFNDTCTNEMGSSPSGDEYVNDIYICDPAFSSSVISEAGAGKMQFCLATYPHASDTSEYWVKSQGYYDDPVSQMTYKAQIIALIKLDPATNKFKITKFQQTDVQPTTAVSGDNNDFFDWEYPL